MPEPNSYDLTEEEEAIVAKFPDEHATLLRQCLSWLRDKEKQWDLPAPIDKTSFCQGVINRASPL